jgi:hypothetical protein
MVEPWEPAFAGQRPAFRPGNEVSVTSGAYSERKLAPLAAEILERARSDPAWPGYLDDPSYSAAVLAWARSEAICESLWRFLVAQDDVADWLAEFSAEECTEETVGKGMKRRRTTAQRAGAALDWLKRFQSIAANHRARLGLDPMSRSRLGRDAATVQVLRQAGVDAVRESGQGALAARTQRLSATESDDLAGVVVEDGGEGGP